MTPGEARYLAHLETHDGAADLGRHLLARREAILRELPPLRSSLPIDAETFERNLPLRTPEPGLDPLMLWLLATAKANQAERYAMELAERYGKISASNPVQLRVSLQEIYHTRVLGDVVALFGLPMRPLPPALGTRTFVHVLLALPERWHLPLAGAAEMAGCVLFRALRDRGMELLAAEPGIATRARFFYDQILADEIGHVGYISLLLGPAGRAVMRGLYRVLGPYFATSMAELVALFGRESLRERFRAEFRLDQLMDGVPGAHAAAMP